MSNILNVEHVSKTFQIRKVLDDVTVGISDTDKIGVIGTNGTGKSTLLSIIAGVERPDEGKIVSNQGLKISYLPQTPVFDETKSLLANITEKIYDGADHWDKMGEVKADLAKMGIQDPECNPSILSGGQKKRAALVAAILMPCDLLILDEPTNHLDTDMIEWLEAYLKRYRGSLLMVTHDRYFLDEVTNQILEVDKGKVYRYEANYSGFLELKQQRQDFEQAAERKAQALYKKDLAWMLRGARARSTKQKAHIKRFEELRDRKRPEEERSVLLNSLNSRMGNKTIILEGISKTYGDRTLFSNFSYTFKRNDRIGIVGPNGCGKSTLIKCLTGDVPVDTGSIEIGQTIKIGYFSQENEALDLNQKVIDYVKDTAEYIETSDGVVTASQMCERFLFDGAMQYNRIEKLSGGEKRRLYLLKILMGAPNVIILDEPTNDLDISTLRILEDYLDSFAGIIITVSHDRYFLDRVVTRIFAFQEDGSLMQSEGAYSDYLARKSLDQKEIEGKENVLGEKKNWKEGQSQKKRLSYKEQREYDHIEKEILALEEESEALEEEINQNAKDFMKLNELSKKKEEVDQKLEERMERFLELQEMVDSFEQA